MKWWFFPVLLMLAGCYQRSSSEPKMRVAASHIDQASHTASAAKDSIVIEEQNKHGEWMVKTYYALKQMGYNYKKTWIYIDSATRTIYRDSIPAWYQMLKQQTDSSIRDKKRYKRVPIM
jgi:hypothetical protein